MFEITPISSEIVKSSAPTFYHKDATFYALQIKGKGGGLTGHSFTNVGLLGIKKLTQENAELELLIFTPYRHRVLTKSRCAKMLEIVFEQGFKRVIIGTERKSLERLCQSFEMDFMFRHEGKSWFMKEEM